MALKIKFEKIRGKSTTDVYIKLTYMHGDADYYDHEKYKMKGITFENYSTHLDAIEKEVNLYLLLSKITDCNHPLYETDYEVVKEKYGEDVANLFDNTPSNEYSRKAHLTNIDLITHNDQGEKFKASIL